MRVSKITVGEQFLEVKCLSTIGKECVWCPLRFNKLS